MRTPSFRILPWSHLVVVGNDVSQISSYCGWRKPDAASLPPPYAFDAGVLLRYLISTAWTIEAESSGQDRVDLLYTVEK